METNVTLISVLLIILLYIPGFLFKRFYYKGPFKHQFHFGVFAERFITSLFWGLVMQILALLISKKFIDISYANLKKPIGDFYTNLCNDKIPDLTFDNLCNIGIYFSITIFVSIVMGFICHTIVRLLKLDLIISALRFQNSWHYYFKGETMESPDKSKLGRVVSTDIDILTQNGDGATKLYSGFLKSYTTSLENGLLETVTITSASRFSNSRNTFVPIKGDCLIIPFERILNMNLRFNRVEKIPLKSKFIVYTFSVFLLAELFVSFYIPIHFSYLGAFKVFWAVVMFVLSTFSLSMCVISPFLDVENSTPKSKIAISLFFAIVTIILSVGLFSILGKL